MKHLYRVGFVLTVLFVLALLLFSENKTIEPQSKGTVLLEKTKPVSLPKKQPEPKQLSEGLVVSGSMLSVTCLSGERLKYLNDLIRIDAHGLSDFQKQFIQKSIENDACHEWHSNNHSLSDEELYKIKKQHTDLKLNILTFSKLDSPEKNKKALEIMSDRNESQHLKNAALKFLMKHDHEFSMKLSQTIGSNKAGLAQTYYSEISKLYSCQYNGEACGPFSMGMIGFCIKDETYCGMSYGSYLQREYHPSERDIIYDLLNAVPTVLSELINDDPF